MGARLPAMLLALMAASGCAKARESSPETPPPRANPETPEPAAPKPTTKPTMDPVSLTWRLSADPKTNELLVDYQVENQGAEPIHLLDTLVIPVKEGLTLAPDRAIVQRGPDKETASVVVGHVRPRPGQAIAFEAVPVAREIKPGEKVSGVKRIPRPLAAWHPYMSVLPLEGEPTRAVLDVSWLPAEPPDGHPAWEDHPGPNGKTIRTPSQVFMRLSLKTTRGSTLPVPK